MDFTLAPRSPRNTVVLVIVLIAALVWIQSMGRGHRKDSGPVPGVLAAAASTLAAPGMPGAGGAPPATATLTPAAEDSLFRRNPFLDLPREAVGNAGGLVRTETTDISPPPRLSGTVIAEGKAMALISGRYYATGAQVLGWRIDSIGPREVRVSRNGETLTLRTGS